MMKIYVWSTPNGRKPLIMAEECGLDYELVPVPLNGAQFEPEFLAINPNGKIPALTDSGAGADGGDLAVFESGAMLIYLAEKTGKFLARTGPDRYAVMQWLMFQMGGVGPMFGQYYHFRHSAPERIEYGVKRYGDEVARLYKVMDGRLADAPFLGGEYSIADMATFPWAAQPEAFGLDRGDFPHVARWIGEIAARPAVQKAMNLTIS